MPRSRTSTRAKMLMPELRGALMPARVPGVTAEYVAGDHSADAARLARLYAGHRGAAERMARSRLELR